MRIPKIDIIFYCSYCDTFAPGVVIFIKNSIERYSLPNGWHMLYREWTYNDDRSIGVYDYQWLIFCSSICETNLITASKLYSLLK